jgi:hypothetical protein
LLGQHLSGVEAGALVAQRDGCPPTHHTRALVSRSGQRRSLHADTKQELWFRRCPDMSFRTTSPAWHRRPIARGVQLLLKDDEVGGQALLDLTRTLDHVVTAASVDRMRPVIGAGVTTVQRGGEAVLDEV